MAIPPVDDASTCRKAANLLIANRSEPIQV